MKTKSLLGALLLLVTSVLVAAPSQSILVAGTNCRIENGKTIFTGSVSLIFKDPSETIKVSADEIVFDQISRREGGVSLLRCSGETVIESAGRTTKGKDLTFEFADMSGNIYILNPNGITIGAGAANGVNFGGFHTPGTSQAPNTLQISEPAKFQSGDKFLPANMSLYGKTPATKTPEKAQ